jgi:hypothetical protein
MSNFNKVLDASKETQKLTTESHNSADFQANKIVFHDTPSISYNNVITKDVELCLDKSRSNSDGFVSFNTNTATNCLKKLLNAYTSNY